MKDKKMINLLNEIIENDFANIVNFAKLNNKNDDFEDFEYFTIEKYNLYFYIQKKQYFNNFEFTIYKKIDFNHIQQISYPKEFDNYEDLKYKIIELYEKYFRFNENNHIPGAFPKILFYELNQYINIKGEKITLLNYIKKIAGYREKEILKNLYKLELKQNNDNYFIIYFYNKDGNYFGINAKNLDRLIIV